MYEATWIMIDIMVIDDYMPSNILLIGKYLKIYDRSYYLSTGIAFDFFIKIHNLFAKITKLRNNKLTLESPWNEFVIIFYCPRRKIDKQL